MYFILILLSALSIFGMDFFLASASKNGVDPILLAFILNIVASAVTGIYLYSNWLQNKIVTTAMTPQIIKYILIAGISSGLISIFFTLAYSKIPISIAAPAIKILAVILISAAGVFFFKEKINIQGIVGYILGITSIILLYTR